MITREKSFPGIIGRGCRSHNATIMRFGSAICGSLGDPFGAQKWPYLRVEVQTEVGNEDKLVRVADEIEAILRREGLIDG